VEVSVTAYVTVGEIARQCGAPEWAARRILDSHFSQSIVRVGRYRTVPASLLPAIRQRLKPYIRKPDSAATTSNA
jgi:hypothetical protein